MRVISTYAHAVLDYLLGAGLLLVPPAQGLALRGQPGAGIATTLPMVYGIFILGQALLTRWELGLFRTVPVRTHLLVDIAAGVFLVISPWLLGYARTIWVPHVLVGLALIGLGMFTRRAAAGAAEVADIDRDRRAA